MWVSYLEIYNESINDLFNKEATNLKLTSDQNHGVSVVGLQKIPVTSFSEVIQMLNYGEENRVYRETNIHEHSSRSHTIFRIYIEKKVTQDASLYSVLNLVDLAGSERLSELDLKQEA